MKQMMMDRVKIGMRAAMMLAVVMIAMFAMPQGAQAQNYKLDGDYVKFMKFVQPDPEEDGKYVDATEAAAGDQILVYIVYDANFPQNRYPTGDFSSNQVTVTKIYDEDGRYKGSGQFTMPARDVTVNAVVAAQEEYTIDLISATSQVIPESVWLLLNGLADNWLIDLNNDSKNDIQLKDVYNESTQVSTYSVIRLAGADYIDSDLSIPLSYVYPLQYNSVLFKLNKKAVQSDWITISGGPFTYTGKAIEPAVTVKDGNTPVAVTVTYSNNKNAGDATVTVTANAQGYTGSASKTFTIAPKAINVAAESKSKKYGEADPALTYTADALIGEDKFSGSLVRVEGENVGTYKIIQGNLSAGDNYNISFTGATLTINPAEVVTTAPTAISGLEYNGGSQVLVNAGSSDHGTVLYSLDGNDYSADLPEGVDAKEYTVYYKFENDANYSTADGGSLQVKIAPKPVTVTTGSATKEYDGTPLTQSEASIEGIVPGERADVIAKGSQTDVGYCTNTYEIVWISANGTNYKVTTENLGTLTVTEKSQQGQGDETVHIPGLPDGAFEREDGLYELEDGSKLEIYTEENGDKNFTNTKENANGTTTVIKIHTDAKGDKFASTTTVTDADGNVIETTEIIKETVTNPDGTETTIETTTTKVTNPDGSTTETTRTTVTDKEGKVIQTTEAITTTATGADGSETTTENIKETVTDKDGKVIQRSETTKETVTDKDGNVIETTETIKETVTNPDGTESTSETIKEKVTHADGSTKETTKEVVTDANGNQTTNSKVTLTDAEGKTTGTTEASKEVVKNANGSTTETSTSTVVYPNTVTWTGSKITKDQLANLISESYTEETTFSDGSQKIVKSETPETVDLDGPIKIDNDDNTNWHNYPTLKDVVKSDNPDNVELLIEQGLASNVLVNTTTEKNAQGQETSSSSSMTIKQTGAAEGGTDAGKAKPTKIAFGVDYGKYMLGVDQQGLGSVLVSPTSAGEGEWVTITAIPEIGYHLAKLYVTDAGDYYDEENAIRPTQSSEAPNQYTFQIPSYNGIRPSSSFEIHVIFEPDGTVSGGTGGGGSVNAGGAHRAAKTMIVNYEKEKTGSAGGNSSVVSSREEVNTSAATAGSLEGEGGAGTDLEKGDHNTGGTTAGSRAATAEEEEDDEIEIVSGQEYRILHDGYVVLNFYTAGGPITVNSIIIRRPGDANNDDYVDAADLVEMINAKNGKASERFNLTNADIDRDGEITQDDIDAVVKLIMK